MTFTVQAGNTDCFYQKVLPNEIIDIEYQVIDATHGELDISFQLADPVGRVIVADYKKPENAHRHTASLEGDYRFCFDNSFSTFSQKTAPTSYLDGKTDAGDLFHSCCTHDERSLKSLHSDARNIDYETVESRRMSKRPKVFFDLMVETEESPEKDYDEDKEMEMGNAAETYMMRVKDISDSVAKVKDHVASARRLQESLSAHEARDRNLAEDMCSRVMMWSMWQIAVMLLVGVTQVVFVKSLFQESGNRVRKFVPNFLSQ